MRTQGSHLNNDNFSNDNESSNNEWENNLDISVIVLMLVGI